MTHRRIDHACMHSLVLKQRTSKMSNSLVLHGVRWLVSPTIHSYTHKHPIGIQAVKISNAPLKLMLICPPSVCNSSSKSSCSAQPIVNIFRRKDRFIAGPYDRKTEWTGSCLNIHILDSGLPGQLYSSFGVFGIWSQNSRMKRCWVSLTGCAGWWRSVPRTVTEKRVNHTDQMIEMIGNLPIAQ